MSELAEGIEKAQSPPAKLWERIREDPLRAPEHIALAASELHAPAAAEWADRRRRVYGTDPKTLAQMARRRHTTMASVEGAATGVGGFITVVPDLVGLAWIQSRLVFYVAAAYGYDPRHPMRPAELLAIQGFYETPEDARRALDGVGKLMAQAMVEKALASRSSDALHRRLVRYLARRFARRAAGRFIPLIGAPIGAVQNGNATKEIGRLTLSYYARP